MACYETMVILRSALDKDAVEAAVAKIGETITKEKGEVVRADHWGKRKLAFPIKKDVVGYYLLFYFKGVTNTVARLEAYLRIYDPVLRFMTIQIEPAALDKVVPQPAELRPLDEEMGTTLPRKPEVEAGRGREGGEEPDEVAGREEEEVEPAIDEEENA